MTVNKIRRNEDGGGGGDMESSCRDPVDHCDNFGFSLKRAGSHCGGISREMKWIQHV